ncbi:MAG TPA: hypothetical protein DCM86_19935 [Verrucomicrobiales bacterium]|nr:hypothetical protein [Verrucomicrobiales bacterium]
MTPGSIHLSAAEFCEAFPYHFAFDRELRVVQFGSNLPRICPRIEVGAPVGGLLELRRPHIPFLPAVLEKNLKELFLIECSSTGTLMRGQIIAREGGRHFLFLGSPWFTDAGEVIAAGLGLHDFAIHDPGMDMLLVMQAQKTALGELKDLTTLLTRQRAELRAANQELKARNEVLQALEQARIRNDKEIRLLSLVASRTDNAVVITDSRGLIVWVNEGFRRITEYTLEEVAHRTPGSVLQGPDTDKGVVAQIRDQVRAGQGFKAELLNYSKSGRKYWIQIEVQPVFDEQGDLVNYLAIETDTTDQRRAQEALRSEKEVLSATLRSIVDGVIVVDDSQRVQLLNPAAETFTGWSSARAAGRPIDEVFVLADPAGSTLPSPLAEAFRTGEVVGNIHTLEGGLLMQGVDGHPVTVVASAVPMLDSEGRVNGGLLVFRDITSELDTKQMRQDFVHSVSHELHTPLTTISGFVTTLLRDPEMPLELRSEFLRIVETQATRLRRLVQDILEISRVEGGEHMYESGEVDLRAITLMSLEEVQAQAETRHIRLDHVLPPSTAPFTGDAARLQSVVTNLLTNAIKFSHERGRVTLRLEVDRAGYRLTVKDDGIGIPKSEQTRIFEKFYRVPRPGRQIPGTGLGLSLTQGIIHHYGGRIEVESDPGTGACFIVHLPRNTPS